MTFLFAYWKWISRKDKLIHYATADQMFLNDAFQNLRRAGVIPRAFRVNDSDRTMHTDAEAIRFCAKNDRFGAFGQAEFFEARF